MIVLTPIARLCQLPRFARASGALLPRADAVPRASSCRSAPFGRYPSSPTAREAISRASCVVGRDTATLLDSQGIVGRLVNSLREGAAMRRSAARQNF